MTSGQLRWLGVLLFGAVSLAPGQAARAGVSTYLSLGDSVAFGETDFSQDPSSGDRGYVGLFADYLGSRAGGVRPNVLNLAIDGETTTSFTTGTGRVAPLGSGLTDATLQSLNLNYAGLTPAPTQNQRLQAAIGAEAAAGHTIDTVTISLGSNDLFALGTSPGFLAATPADQQAMLLNTLAQLGANYGALVTEVHALAPSARVLLLSSYNPYPADPSSPFAPLAALAIPALDAVISNVATATNATYVDISSIFVGHEASLTHMLDLPAGSDNVHPNAAGYAAIAAALDAADAVPEPSSLTLFATGAIGLLAGCGWRRARAGGRVAQ
jgi:lysophospholipase L1-like esterase